LRALRVHRLFERCAKRSRKDRSNGASRDHEERERWKRTLFESLRVRQTPAAIRSREKRAGEKLSVWRSCTSSEEVGKLVWLSWCCVVGVVLRREQKSALTGLSSNRVCGSLFFFPPLSLPLWKAFFLFLWSSSRPNYCPTTSPHLLSTQGRLKELCRAHTFW
jgi:hypothetical protein